MALENTQKKLSQDTIIRRKQHKNQLVLTVGILCVYIFLNIILKGRLLEPENINIILAHSVFPALIAWGMSFFFSAGIIDLSVGANVILSANIGSILAGKFGLGYPGFIIGTIIACIIFEQCSIHCSITLGIPSWISGLGMALILEAILAFYVSSKNIMGIILPDNLRVLGEMPTMAIVMFAALAIAYFLFNRTSIGMNIKAVGGNEAVARAMGIDKKKTIIIGALIGGIFIGLGAVVQMSYSGRIDATTGLGSLGMIFQALAGVLLAGSLGRIVSAPVGIFVSSIFVMSIFNVLTIFGVPSGSQDIFLGAIVILCGILSNLNYKGVVK